MLRRSLRVPWSALKDLPQGEEGTPKPWPAGAFVPLYNGINLQYHLSAFSYTVINSPGWSRTCSTAEDKLEFRVFPLLPPECLDLWVCTTLSGFCSAGDWTQDPMHARWALYPPSHMPSPSESSLREFSCSNIWKPFRLSSTESPSLLSCRRQPQSRRWKAVPKASGGRGGTWTRLIYEVFFFLFK